MDLIEERTLITMCITQVDNMVPLEPTPTDMIASAKQKVSVQKVKIGRLTLMISIDDDSGRE